MLPFCNNLEKDNRVLDTVSGRQGKVHQTPRKPTNRKTSIIFDGIKTPKKIDVMQLRLVIDGKPEDCAPVDGEPPATQAPTAGRFSSPAIDVLKDERALLTAKMKELEGQFLAMRRRTEQLDQAIKCLEPGAADGR